MSVSGLFIFFNYLTHLYHTLWMCYMMQTLFHCGFYVRNSSSKETHESAEQPFRQKNVCEGWIPIGWENVSGFTFYVTVVSARLQWIILRASWNCFSDLCFSLKTVCVSFKDTESQSSHCQIEISIHCQSRPFSTVFTQPRQAPSQQCTGVHQYSLFSTYFLNEPICWFLPIYTR